MEFEVELCRLHHAQFNPNYELRRMEEDGNQARAVNATVQGYERQVGSDFQVILDLDG